MKDSILSKTYVAALLLVFFTLHHLYAQSVDTTEVVPPKIFLNCSGNCAEDFVKTELSLFDFVRDQVQADIQVLIINEGNAGGGQLYTLIFIGQNDFDALVDTLTFSTIASDTQALMQEQLLTRLKQGLIRYLARTQLTSQVELNFKKREPEAVEIVEDKWDYWVFTVEAEASFSGESNRRSVSLDNSVAAKRVTNESRMSMYAFYDYDREKFTVNEKRITANYSEYGLNSRYVKSFTEHWSGGIIYSFYHSVFSNIQASHAIAPAIEYNLYPYSENIQQQFRLAYQIGYNPISFIQETIYDRTQQHIPYQKFSAGTRLY